MIHEKATDTRRCSLDKLGHEAAKRGPSMKLAIRYSTFAILGAVSVANAQSGGAYLITKSTVDGGGSTSHTGGNYALGGTVGQPDAAALTGGTYALKGGFWTPTLSAGSTSPTKGNDDVCVGGGNAGAGCAQNSDCPGGSCRNKNRYITAVIPNTATSNGLKVNIVSMDANSAATPGNYNGTDRWVGAPTIAVPDGVSGVFNAGKIQCAFVSVDWSAVGQLHIYGDVIVPSSTYDVSSCNPQATCSAALRIATARFGDVIVPTPAVNFQDVQSIVAKFQGTPAGPSKTRSDLVGQILIPNNPINFQDVSANVSAFQSKTFKTVVPTPPVTCP